MELPFFIQGFDCCKMDTKHTFNLKMLGVVTMIRIQNKHYIENCTHTYHSLKNLLAIIIAFVINFLTVKHRQFKGVCS